MSEPDPPQTSSGALRTLQRIRSGGLPRELGPVGGTWLVAFVSLTLIHGCEGDGVALALGFGQETTEWLKNYWRMPAIAASHGSLLALLAALDLAAITIILQASPGDDSMSPGRRPPMTIVVLFGALMASFVTTILYSVTSGANQEPSGDWIYWHTWFLFNIGSIDLLICALLTFYALAMHVQESNLHDTARRFARRIVTLVFLLGLCWIYMDTYSLHGGKVAYAYYFTLSGVIAALFIEQAKPTWGFMRIKLKEAGARRFLLLFACIPLVSAFFFSWATREEAFLLFKSAKSIETAHPIAERLTGAWCLVANLAVAALGPSYLLLIDFLRYPRSPRHLALEGVDTRGAESAHKVLSEDHMIAFFEESERTADRVQFVVFSYDQEPSDLWDRVLGKLEAEGLVAKPETANTSELVLARA